MKVGFSNSYFFSIAAYLNKAVAWWWQGLSDLWPEKFRSFTSKAQSILWKLEKPLSQMDLSEESLNAYITQNLSQEISISSIESFHVPKDTPIIINLHAEDLLFLTLLLPGSAQSKLQEAVNFQLITEAPLPRNDLYFDSHIARRIDKHRIEVQVDICKKETVNALASFVERQGFVNISIGFSAEPSEKLDSIFYTSSAIKSAESQSRKMILLSTCIAFSLLAFSPLLYTAASLKMHTLSQRNNELQAKVNRYADLLAKRGRQESITTDLIKQLPRYRLTNALNQIASLMPSTAWITSIKFDQGVMQLIGNAENPTTLMQVRKNLPLAHPRSCELRGLCVTCCTLIEPTCT